MAIGKPVKASAIRTELKETTSPWHIGSSKSRLLAGKFLNPIKFSDFVGKAAAKPVPKVGLVSITGTMRMESHYNTGRTRIIYSGSVSSSKLTLTSGISTAKISEVSHSKSLSIIGAFGSTTRVPVPAITIKFSPKLPILTSTLNKVLTKLHYTAGGSSGIVNLGYNNSLSSSSFTIRPMQEHSASWTTFYNLFKTAGTTITFTIS